MIELYDFELFASPTKVRMHLAEKGLEWTRRRVDIGNLDHKREAYLALNPAGLVPTLRHGDALLVEADVIMEYIEDTFDGPSLRPQDTFERAWMRLWLKTIEQMHDAYSVAFQDQIALPLHRRRSVEERRALLSTLPDPFEALRIERWIETDIAPADVERALGAVETVFDQMDGQLADSTWLTGETFSLADIAMLPYVDTPMHLVSALWYRRKPRIARWLERVRARPSYDKAVTAFPPTPEGAEAIAQASAGGGRRAVAA
jgi:glutathione S-transferase